MYGYVAKKGNTVDYGYDYKTLLGVKRDAPNGFMIEIFEYKKEVPQKIKEVGGIPDDAVFVVSYQKG